MRSIKLPSWIEPLLGLDPVPAPPHVFAVTETELRYAAFHRGPQGFAYDVEKRVDLPADTFLPGPLGGPLRDVQGFQERLASLVAEIDDVEEASLVLPDTWMRLTFTEIDELPQRAKARQDVLAWKLKRLVPFRVEELRIDAAEVTPFLAQEEPHRLLLGFAIEALVTQLETAFADAGVRLGSITNTTLAILASLEHTLAPGDLAALLAVYDDSFTLSFCRDGEPLLYRYKAFDEGGVHSDSVTRDLRMTSTFLRQHFPGQGVNRVFLAAPAEVEEQWRYWMEGELGASTEPLRFDHFGLSRTRTGAEWERTAPMIGAVRLEVT